MPTRETCKMSCAIIKNLESSWRGRIAVFNAMSKGFGVEMFRSKLYKYCMVTLQWKWLEKLYPAFEALILSDLMFNRSLKSGLVSFCMGEVKGKHITHLLTMNYASNHWENKYTIILWIKVGFNLSTINDLKKGKVKKILYYHSLSHDLDITGKILVSQSPLKNCTWWQA